jgi:phage tail sheath protein FI
MSDFTRLFGQRVSYSVLYDAVDIFFREGGSSVWVNRIVGPAATFGSLNLNDNVAAVSLVAKAVGPGAWSTQIKVGVVAGGAAGSFQIQVTDLSTPAVILEQSNDLLVQTDAVTWSANSDYIRITLGASTLNPIVVAPAALSAGTDDRASVAEGDWTAALDEFTIDMGPGQVSAPGRSTDAAHTALLAHAATHRRVALLDPADTPTVATLLTAVTNARVGNQRFGALFAPWAVAPGIITGTLRTVPPSAFVAGLISRNEDTHGPDSPSAGVNGIARYCNGPSQPLWTDSQREQLNNGAVNVLMTRLGQFQCYGWRSLVSATSDPNWIPFGNSRLYMGIAADADGIAEGFVFDIIDGQGHTISDFGGALAGMLLEYYTRDQLYGATAEEAFIVDVGPQVNTPDTIANNELHAVLNVRMSPMAELVAIQIVKTPITQAVS